jgi:hypothetical protein
MSNEEEKSETDAPESDELGMGGGHAVTLAVDAGGTLFLDEALEGEVEGFAGELAGKGEANLGFAGGVDEGGVDDAKGLGEEGEVGAEEGESVVGVLLGLGKKELVSKGQIRHLGVLGA